MDQRPDEIRVEAVASTSSKAKGVVAALLGAMLLVALTVGATLAVTGQFEDDSSSNIAPDTAVTSEVIDDSQIDDNKDDDVVETKATWQIAARVENPPIFSDLEGYYASEGLSADGASYVQTYKVGDLDDGREVLILESPIFGIGASEGFTVIIQDGERYSVLANSNSSQYFTRDDQDSLWRYIGPALNANAVLDFESSLPGLVFEKQFVFNGQQMQANYIAPSLLKTVDPEPLNPGVSTQIRKIGSIAGGDLYETTTGNEKDPYRISSFRLKLPSGLIQSYSLTGELTRETIDPIIWSDRSRNVDDYLSAGRGCGSVFGGGNEIAINLNKDDLPVIGRSVGGQTIYGFPENDPLLALHYSEYDSAYNPDSTYPVYEDGDGGLTLDQFIENRGVYIVEDALGRLLVFSNQRYVPAFGCAKPVVYLYPEQTTTVNVEVGADVTISEPQYEEDGWQGVVAHPDGTLEYRGQEYDSLFWEGFGHGAYPDIDKGFVGRTDNAVSMWENHLVQLGLNKAEIADFTEFWIEKLPSTEFVRISWLGTADMDRLAPLKVSEDFDTSIRVFMDMEGLSRYEDMPQQRLGAPERTGFTVVEWGGLARDGSVPTEPVLQ